MGKVGLYMIENKTTGRMLIGSTKNLTNRKSQHFSYLRRNKHPNHYLQASFNKWGKDNFLWKVITITKTLQEARLAEQFWLDFYWNYSWEGLYNTNNLANGGCSVKWTAKRKKIWSKKFKENNPMLYPKNRIKISKAIKGIKRKDLAERNKKFSSKSVTQYKLTGEKVRIYSSVREASRETGIGFSSIYNNCLGYNKTAHGYIWEYSEK